MSDAETPEKLTKAVAVKKGRDEKASSASISAKGKGYLAERILDIAFDKGIAVRQDSTLTDILSELEVDSPIPLEAIDAVAEVFRQLYLLDQGLDPAVKINHPNNQHSGLRSGLSSGQTSDDPIDDTPDAPEDLKVINPSDNQPTSKLERTKRR